MSTWRRYRSWVLLALLIGAGFGLVRAATSEPSLRYATDRIAERLKERFGLILEVGHVGAQPGSARVEASPVTLRGDDGEVIFQATRIAVELAPLQMFARRVQLDALEIEDPQLNVRIRDGRVVGIKPIELEDGDSEPLFRVDVEDFRVRDAAITVQVDDVTTRVTGIDMRLRSSGPDGHRLKFRVDRAEVERPGDLVVVDEFDGRLVVFGDGLLAPERVSVSDLTFTSEDATVNVGGSILLGKLGLLPAVDLDVNAVASLPAVLSHVDVPVEVDGAVTVGARISSALGGEDLKVAGQGDVTDLRVEGFHIGTLRGRFLADAEQVEIPAASFHAGDTTVEGHAQLRFDEALSYTVSARGQDFSLYRLLHDLKFPEVWAEVLIDGQVDGQGHLLPSFVFDGDGAGHLHDLKVASRDVHGVPEEDLVLEGAHPIFADLQIHADPVGLRFDGHIDDGETRASGYVQLNFDIDQGLELLVESDRASFDSVLGRIAGLEFGGEGGGSLEISGPYDDPNILAEAYLRGFALEGFAFGDLAGKIRSRRSILGFHEVTAHKGRSVYRGDVILDFERQDQIRVTRADEDGGERRELVPVRGLHIGVDIDVERAQAEELRAIIPARYEDGVLGFLRTLDLEGPLSGHGRAFGYIADGTTDHLQGDGVLHVAEGAQLLGQTLTNGTGRFGLDLDAFHIDGLSLAAAGGTVAVNADIQRADGAIDGHLKMADLELGRIDALLGTQRPFRGRFDVDAALSHHAGDPTLTGRARIIDAAWGEYPIGDANVVLRHEGRVLTLKGPVLSGRGDGVITVGTRDDFAYTASIQVSPGPAAPLLPEDFLPDGVAVQLGGAVDAHGALRAFSESRGTVALSPASLEYGSFRIDGTGDVLAHFRGARLTVDQLEMTTPRGDGISLRGVISSDEVDVQASGRGDLWFLPAFTRHLDSSKGRFRFDVAITGDLDHAAMNGRARVTQGRLQIARFEPVVDDLDAQILLRGPNVLLESVRATVGGSPARGQGTVTLSGATPTQYDLEATFQDLSLTVPSWLPSRSSGRVTLKGPAELPTLAGEMRVLQATYSEDINWERLLPDLRRRVEAPRVFDKEEEDVRFDLHLVADNGVVIENNVLDLEAKGDLYLVGTEERPGLKGNLSLLRGNAHFRGNRYRLLGGNVEFVDTYRISPILDVEAETEIKDYDITARVSGPLKNPRIDLSSRPELAEIDILALLTFGFTQYELKDANASAGAAGLEVVSAYSGLEREVRRILPDAVREMGAVSVDELRLTSQFSSRQGANVPAVAVGFEMNPGPWLLFGLVDESHLRLQSTLIDVDGNGTEQRLEWEKRFDNELRLRLVWSSQDRGSCPNCNNQWGDFGGDVWYRWEF